MLTRPVQSCSAFIQPRASNLSLFEVLPPRVFFLQIEFFGSLISASPATFSRAAFSFPSSGTVDRVMTFFAFIALSLPASVFAASMVAWAIGWRSFASWACIWLSNFHFPLASPGLPMYDPRAFPFEPVLIFDSSFVGVLEAPSPHILPALSLCPAEALSSTTKPQSLQTTSPRMLSAFRSSLPHSSHFRYIFCPPCLFSVQHDWVRFVFAEWVVGSEPSRQVYYIGGEVLKPYYSCLILGITRIIHVSLTDYTTIRNTESNEFKNRKNNTQRERSLLYRRVS